jgi:AbrB family looped-hinge helix DNA binding protein
VIRLASKLTTKGQATIPKEVRKLLGVAPGDTLHFVIDGKNITLKRAALLDAAFLKLASKSFADWNDPEADKTFRDL